MRTVCYAMVGVVLSFSAEARQFVVKAAGEVHPDDRIEAVPAPKVDQRSLDTENRRDRAQRATKDKKDSETTETGRTMRLFMRRALKIRDIEAAEREETARLNREQIRPN